MEIKDNRIDSGKAFDWGKTSVDYAKYRDIYPQEFYFRKQGDYRKGVEVKKEQIEKILEKYNVVAIIDDCEPIVQMYRDMGLTVLQPNKGL